MRRARQRSTHRARRRAALGRTRRVDDDHPRAHDPPRLHRLLGWRDAAAPLTARSIDASKSQTLNGASVSMDTSWQRIVENTSLEPAKLAG
jgi:hypothetical protein